MNKKKILRVIALVVALALIVGIGVFANALVGNPISKYLAKNAAEKLIEEEHPDTDFYVEKVIYNFKVGGYHIYVNSDESPDSAFGIWAGFFGDIYNDSYEDVITNKRNTADRIWKEYRDATDKIFDSTAFPYYDHISYGDIEFRDRESVGVDYDLPSYGIVTDTLELDAYYDIKEMGRKAGHLVLYVYDEEVTIDRLCKILLDVKDIFNSAGIEFYAIDCVVEYPKPEDEGEERRDGRVEVENFLCEDIYEEGLADRVKEANRKAEEYHAERDALKEKEIEAYLKTEEEQEQKK